MGGHTVNLLKKTLELLAAWKQSSKAVEAVVFTVNGKTGRTVWEEYAMTAARENYDEAFKDEETEINPSLKIILNNGHMLHRLEHNGAELFEYVPSDAAEWEQLPRLTFDHAAARAIE